MLVIPSYILLRHTVTVTIHTKLRSNVMYFVLAGSQKCCTKERRLVSDTLRTAWATTRDRRSEVPARLVPIHLGQALPPTIPE